MDENGVIHEVISADNSPAPGLLGGHANPGHSIEDMWFQLTAAETLDRKDLIPKIVHIVDKTLEIGWDFEYGGLLHYVGVNGEPVVGLAACTAKETTQAPATETEKVETPEENPAPVEETPAEKEPVTLEWYYRGNGIQQDTEKVQAAFNL